ncbi:25591_t:CDS:2, partial [Racocetra persica]
NKYKISIKEDIAVSTGMQNQRSIVVQESTLAAADHDFSKLSLTLSVVFLISIPNDISRSFYNGQVGSDHHCNYGSVQIALISLFLCRDFDLLVAVCVVLKHNSMSPESENLFEMVNTLGDIHKKAEGSNKLESELKECIM